LTDYGLKDSFVGMMKGVVLGINPHAKIIDVTHNIERYNIYEASQVLGMSYKYFPPSTIHVVVIDPGVGGERRPVLVITENHYFIGPDNGVFTHIYENELSSFFKVIHLTSSHYFLPVTGSTFHGRDIFAPVAAWLSKGMDSQKLGEQISDYIKIPSPKITVSDGNIIHGEVVFLDHYGNAITNIALEDLSRLAPAGPGNKFTVTYKDRDVPFLGCYAEAAARSLSATINGFGRLELFVNRDNAAGLFNIGIGDRVSARPAN